MIFLACHVVVLYVWLNLASVLRRTDDLSAKNNNNAEKQQQKRNCYSLLQKKNVTYLVGFLEVSSKISLRIAHLKKNNHT